MEPELLTSASDWIVVSKPAGWLSVPGRETSDPVLLEWLRQKLGEEIFPVHRLDRETSGVILFARGAQAHRRANQWFMERKTKKIYHCIAIVPASSASLAPVFKLDQPIEGARSLTQVEVKERYAEGILAQVRPLTGRRHQIRIHLSRAGFPLWGDSLYGGPKQIEFPSRSLRVERVALHASVLELPTGERFEAPWPEDFTGWVEALRKEGRRVA